MAKSSRTFLAVLLALLVISPESFAFNSPLSEEAIREAYFLGQRRDESTARFLAKYKQSLAVPKTGPYIASVELLTPFARAVFVSSQQTMGYSAQQAEAEYRENKETIAMTIEVLLTSSYGPLIVRPTGQRAGSPVGIAFRSPDFWEEAEVQVTVSGKIVKPAYFDGEPNYVYTDEGRRLTGATLRFEFPADAFTSNAATVQVSPPEGPEVIVDFDLTTLR
jgi:hypothetical protein